MIVADGRLLELASVRPHGRDVSRLALRIQTLASTRYNHVIDMTSEAVWRRLRRAGRTGYANSIVLRCMRCEVSNYLRDWYILLTCSPDTVTEILASYLPADQPLAARCVQLCDGDIMASNLSEITAGRGIHTLLDDRLPQTARRYGDE